MSADEESLAPGQLRKHPYHKDSWGPYPNIEISHDPTADDENKQDQNISDILGNAKRKKESMKNTNTFYRIKTIKFHWIIKYIAKYSMIWEFFIYLVISLSLSIISFTAFFAFYEQVLWQWLTCLEMVFAVDTILRLGVEVWRYQARATVVVFTAPYTMLQFILDAFSMIPLHQLYYWAMGGCEQVSELSNLDYFRLNKMVRISRLVKFFDALENRRVANERLLFVFKFANYYFGFIIFTTCLLVWAIGVDPMDYLLYRDLQKLKTSYLNDFQKKKKGYGATPWDIFVITTNFATAVITTVGYGDVSPNNEMEMVICIICMLFGAIFLNGNFTGEMTNFEVEFDGARFDLYHRLEGIKNYLSSMNALPFFTERVQEYYSCLWTYREGVSEVQFMDSLPDSFHEELNFDICQEMFDKSFLFNNLDPAFLRAVSKIVTVALYIPEMILCKQGGYANKMYYILQGECQAMSKLNPANPAAVLRAGSIIAETNLFFSYPYTATVETKTCCQFIIIQKNELLAVCDKFPHELQILRSRHMTKLANMYESYQAFGMDPVCWVKALTDQRGKLTGEFRRQIRLGSGWNRKVTSDIINDLNENVIFETPVSDPTVWKDHLIPYRYCALPEILKKDSKFYRVWNVFMMCFSLFYAFTGPYCLVFPESTKMEFYVCRAQTFLSKLITFIYLVDVFVEIFGACPVSGWYFKFWDGLSVVRHRFIFYIDCLAALPVKSFIEDPQSFFNIMWTMLRVAKLWKVIRFLHYLENKNPLKLFTFRLAQTLMILMYGIHFIACICYTIACPYDDNLKTVSCLQQSWLASHEITFNESSDFQAVPTRMKTNYLGYSKPYLYSFYYSTVTLTSAGFGDFNPQNRTEMLWAIGFMLFGFFLCGYYTALLTSALSCIVRPNLALQQQLASLYQFMNYYHIRENLRDRIVEYLTLQHQYRGGVTLEEGKHIMHDAPPYLRDDVLYMEAVDLLDGVPVFSKLDQNVIIKLSGSMKRFIIPPNTTFVQKGDVRRILYIIKDGSMGIFDEGMDHPVSLLLPSSHFGVRDLLFGEPSHYTIRSQSHVALYAVRRKDFEEALGEDDDFWAHVSAEKERNEEVIHEMTMLYSTLDHKKVAVDTAKHTPSWVEVPRRVSQEAVDKDKNLAKINDLNDEYDDAFKDVKMATFIRFFLLRKTIHPAGFFSKAWNCYMSLIASLTLTTLMVETFCYVRPPWFRWFQIYLDWMNFMDIYLKFHWAYYNPHNGMLVTHPLKTALNYVLNGSLVMDVAISAPVELNMWIFGSTTFFGYGRGATWYSRLRWFRFLQIKRIPMCFTILHDIFTNRSVILLSLYVSATLLVCVMISAVAIYIACPWEINDWKKGDEYRIPICTEDSWVDIKFEKAQAHPQVISGVLRRSILGMYYVSQVFLVIGFGDMVTLFQADIFLLMFMCIFGFIFMRCIVGDMTAAEVNSDEARVRFVENMTVLDLVMQQEKVPKKLSFAVISHLRHTWNRSKGLQPRELFGELHPVLESEVYKFLVGDRLQKIPIFHNFPPTILRSICRYLKTQYMRRGERIMRYGNLENEMCIIVSGKVFITDQYMNYICSLGPGKSFGESSLIYGVPRRHNAIAATNVEISTLTVTRFENFLGRYPSFRNDMKANLDGKKKDYFEKEIEEKIARASKLSGDRKQKMLNMFVHRTKHIKELVSHVEDKELSGLKFTDEQEHRAKGNKLIGYGELDDNLPLIYFCAGSHAHSHKKKKFVCQIVIHPNSRLIKMFLSFLTWFCVISPALAAYEVCFSGDRRDIREDAKNLSAAMKQSLAISQNLEDLSDFIEYIFLFSIILQFFLAYQMKPGIFSKNQKSIALRYLTALDGFIFDLVACAPFILDSYMDATDTKPRDLFKTKNVEKFMDNFILLRCIRLLHYYKSQVMKKDDLDVSTFRLQITLSVTTFILMAHMLACLFYWMSPCSRPDIKNKTFISEYTSYCPGPTLDEGLDLNSWTSEYANAQDFKTNPKQLEAWRWWFRSLYWVVTTISTTGFGDIVPYKASEMVVGIICIFCGAFILSIILSQFTSGMASLTRAKREYMYQVLLLCKHLKNIGLSKIREEQVMMYFITLWERCRGVPYHECMNDLPVAMQIEVAFALFGSTLLQVPFFEDSPEHIFIRQLSARAKHALYIPGTYIQKEGDPGSKLYVVYKGLVSGIKNTVNEVVHLEAIYNPGDAFGRFTAFFINGTYHKSYRAETMVEVLQVKQKDIAYLAKVFPKFKQLIFNYVASRYNMEHGYNTSIFNKPRRRGKVFGIGDEMLFGQAAKTVRK